MKKALNQDGKLIHRIGETKVNNSGSIMKIIEYYNCHDCTVEFQNGEIVYNADYRHFKNGNVLSCLDKTVCGIGYIGNGKYQPKDNNVKKFYMRWFDMINRCYGHNSSTKYPSYIGCTVCEEWHNFQNFAEWCINNYYEVGAEKMQIDKDILVKGNKVYSPQTCIFAPVSINNLFITQNKHRELPDGVYKHHKKYRAIVNDLDNRICSTVFDTIKEAVKARDSIKQTVIKNRALLYEGKIPEKLFEILMNYNVKEN